MLIAFIWFLCAALYLVTGIALVVGLVRVKGHTGGIGPNELALLAVLWPLLLIIIIVVALGDGIGSLIMKLGTKK